MDLAQFAHNPDADEPQQKRQKTEIDAPSVFEPNYDGLDPDQRRALDLALAGKSFFMTGPGGHGKSFVIRRIVKELGRRAQNAFVTASTGIASVPIGGRTLHSFLSIPIDRTWGGVRAHSLRNAETKARVLKTNTLIIDEISMISDRVFNWTSELLKVHRGSEKPFGGVQMIFVGDFYQLPPVSTRKTASIYGRADQFCFTSDLWDRVVSEVVRLRTNHRQDSDDEFLRVLMALRVGRLTNAQIQKLYVRSTTHDVSLQLPSGAEPVCLVPLKSTAKEHNDAQMKKLDEHTEHTYSATTKITASGGKPVTESIAKFATTGKAKDARKLRKKADEFKKRIEKNMMAPQECAFRVGAQVLLLCNLSVELGLANGTQGVVTGFAQKADRSGDKVEYPVVEFGNGRTRTIVPWTWEVQDQNTVLKASYRQIPLLPSWSVTIHKAQGMTLGAAKINIGKECFADGMAYTALSRVERLDCVLISEFNRNCLKASAVVEAKFKEGAAYDAEHSKNTVYA